MQTRRNVSTKILHLSRVAQACDQTGISDRTAAIITSFLLVDLKKVTNDDNSSVIDRHKIRRYRQKVRTNLKEQDTLSALLKKSYAVFFDGRIDKALVNVKKHEKYVKSNEKFARDKLMFRL